MAIRIEFEGAGEGLQNSIRDLIAEQSKLRKEVEQTNAATKQGAEQSVAAQQKVITTTEALVATVAEVNVQAKSGDSKILVSNMNASAAAAEGLADSIRQIGQGGTMKAVADQAKEFAKQTGLVVGQLSQEKKAIVDILVASKALTKEEGLQLEEAIAIGEAFQEQEVALTKTATQAQGLRAQFQEAKAEAAAMIAQFGEFSPEAIQATQRAAALKDQISDLNQRLDALNPDSKLGGFVRFGSAISSGAQALGGFISAFSEGGGPIQEAALRLQSFVLGLQGAREFFTELQDAFKDVRIAIESVTTAQKASTVAAGLQGRAMGGVGTASTVATSGIRSFTASLLSSPLAPFAIALAAIGGAFALLSDDAEDAKEEIEGFFETLEILRGLQTQDIDKRLRLNELQKEQALIGVESAREQGEITRQFAIRENELLKEKQKLVLQNADALDREIEAKSKAGDLDDEAKKDLEERSSALRAEAKQLETDIALQVAGANVETLKFRAQIKEQEAASAQERRQIREQLAKDLAAVEKQLADAVRASQLEQADPLERLRLEKQARDQDIDDRERELLRKKALLEVEADMVPEAFKALTEAQKEAKADQLISEGDIQLTLKQQDQLNLLRLNSELQYLDARTALKRENDELILSTQKDSADKQRAQLEIDLQARAEQLRKAGATEVQIAEDAARQRATLDDQLAQQARDTEEAIAIARIEAIRDSGPQTEAAIQAAERQILQVKIRFAQEALDAIVDDGEKETEKRKAQLEATVAKLQAELGRIQAQTPKFNLLDLLGVKKEDQEFVKQAANDIFNNLRQLVEDSLSAQQEEVQGAIDATDQIIEDRERRIDELRSQLDQEIELGKQGLANNIDTIREQIKVEEEKAKKERQRRAELLADQRRIAKEQLAIDAAIQASQIIVASAKIMSQAAGLGPFGIAIGIAEIAIMIGAFVAAQARARAAVQAQQTELRGGGYSHFLQGPSHEEGGLGIYNEKTGQKIAEAEGGEAFFIVNKRTSNRRRKMIEALNEENIPMVADLAIAELMRANNIQLKGDSIQKVIELKNTQVVHATIVHEAETESLKKEIRALGEKVDQFKKQEHKAHQEVESFGPNGERIKRTEGVTIVTRKVTRHGKPLGGRK